jgi:hypothetical protein
MSPLARVSAFSAVEPWRADYAVKSAGLILARAGLPSIHGKEVLEVGPGDHLGVGLTLLALGARRITAIDRFVVDHDPSRQKAIYREIAQRFSGLERQRLENAFDDDGLLRDDRLRLITRASAEDANRILPEHSVDLVISVAVGEHLSNVGRSMSALDAVLVPRGVQIHQIDLRDHGLFTSRGFGPLEWLTTSERVHAALVRWSGGPNRVLAPDYRRLMTGRKCRITISQVAGSNVDLDAYPERLKYGEHYGETEREMVTEIRPRLASRFRSWAEEDLLAAGIVLRIGSSAALDGDDART